MANYPQIDDCSGIWKLKDVNDAVMGGYWRVGGTRALFGGGNQGESDVIDFITIVSTGDAADFGDLTPGGESSGGFGSHTRAFFLISASPSNAIDFVNITQQVTLLILVTQQEVLILEVVLQTQQEVYLQEEMVLQT